MGLFRSGDTEAGFPDAARGFDRVLVMDHGRLVDEGDYRQLTRPDGPLEPLMAAE
jgi:ABC-type transport system involved in cytochrome bd biosynthesis fused ATPase/permease subunit